MAWFFLKRPPEVIREANTLLSAVEKAQVTEENLAEVIKVGARLAEMEARLLSLLHDHQNLESQWQIIRQGHAQILAKAKALILEAREQPKEGARWKVHLSEKRSLLTPLRQLKEKAETTKAQLEHFRKVNGDAARLAEYHKNVSQKSSAFTIKMMKLMGTLDDQDDAIIKETEILLKLIENSI